MLSQGFVRILHDDEVVRIEDARATQLKTADVVVDRVSVNDESLGRLVDACALALKAGRGQAHVKVVGAKAKEKDLYNFSNKLACNSSTCKTRSPKVSILVRLKAWSKKDIGRSYVRQVCP